MYDNAEMGIYMLGNILQTRCMVSEFISLLMDTDMKVPGMKEEGRGLECTLSEMGKPNLVTGKMASFMFPVFKMLSLDLLMLPIPLKFSMQSR